MGVGHHHGLEARVLVKEWVLRWAPPLHRCVQRREEFGAGLTLNWNGDAALIELNQNQGERCATRSAHLSLIANRDQVTTRTVGTKCVRKLWS